MVIKSRDGLMERGIEVDLSGPQGNAFYLLGLAGKLAKELGLDKDDILRRMKAGDYENLVRVFEDEFGDVVTLYR